MARTRNWTYFQLDREDGPYGVLRFDEGTGRTESYDPGKGDWFYTPSEVDMVLGGEAGATEIPYSEVETLIAGGKLAQWLPENRAAVEVAG